MSCLELQQTIGDNSHTLHMSKIKFVIYLKKCRFPAAIGTQKHPELAGGDGERAIVDNWDKISLPSPDGIA